LLADPDEVLLEIVQSFLFDRGHEAEVASNGLECMSWLRQFVPDVLVLDQDLLWGGSDGVLARMIDDHEWIREGLRYTFRRTEIEIGAEATTWADAVRFALEEVFDVALLDFKMPGGNAVGALSQISAGKPDLPVLIYSAYGGAASIERCMSLGVCGYLCEGVEKQVLIDAVREASAGKKLRQNPLRSSPNHP
jgi:DNA-binding NtrC family response regulator